MFRYKPFSKLNSALQALAPVLAQVLSSFLSVNYTNKHIILYKQHPLQNHKQHTYTVIYTYTWAHRQVVLCLVLCHINILIMCACMKISPSWHILVENHPSHGMYSYHYRRCLNMNFP